MRLTAIFSIPAFTFRRFSLLSYVFAVVIVALFPPDLFAQRITYESLRIRDEQPKVFVEHLVIPGSGTSELTLVTTFRLENNFLTFRRYRGDAGRTQTPQFSADPTVRVSIREATGSDSRERESRTAQRRDERPNGGVTVATNSWSETVFAETFEQTQSSGLFVQNMIKTSLAPGRYDIETSMTADNRTRRNRVPHFRLSDSSDTDIAYFYFLDGTSGLTTPFQAPLMNMGRNVYFGRDHQLAIWIPDDEDVNEYRLEIHELRVRQRDTTETDLVFEHTIDRNNLLTGYAADIKMESDRPHFFLQQSGDGASTGSFYLLPIPNSTFKNAHFRIRIMKTSADSEEKVLARRIYQSLWLDMPVSLYNLDVAVNMMRFMADEETIRQLRRGSRQTREERFHEFWRQRDPSPENEYNELMVEYYRRIDYAYEHFTTPQKPGYESDQGKVYITNGEPDRKERTFPPNQAARETWHYGSRVFVFEATTGFGDYRLLERK